MEQKVEMCFFDRNQAIDSDGNTVSVEIPYIVFGASTEDDALALVRAATPASYNGVALETVEIDERLAEEIYKVRAIYPENTDSGGGESGGGGTEEEPSFSFDTGGGMKHLTQSLATVGSYPDDAPDFGGAIEVDEDNNVNGCDIIMPIMTFSETHWYSNSKVTTAFKKQLSELTGSVNASAFKGYDAGEVLFQGASGSRRGKKSSDKWEITYKFAVSPNVRNLRIGSITVAEKDGWDYLWVKYHPDVDDASKTLIKKPQYAYVEKVYERKDFSILK